MELVTVAVFTSAFNAHVSEGRLRAEGIEAYIKDEHTIQVNPFYNNALGGIKLQVKDTDVDEARRILAESGYRWPLPQTPQRPKYNLFVRFLIYLFWTAVLLTYLYFLDFKKSG
jgi:hypothetical protein